MVEKSEVNIAHNNNDERDADLKDEFQQSGKGFDVVDETHDKNQGCSEKQAFHSGQKHIVQEKGN